MSSECCFKSLNCRVVGSKFCMVETQGLMIDSDLQLL